MWARTQRSGIHCLILAVLLAVGNAESSSVATPASWPDTDQTELLQRQLDVNEAPMMENSVASGSDEVEGEDIAEEDSGGSEDPVASGSDEAEDIVEEDNDGADDSVAFDPDVEEDSVEADNDGSEDPSDTEIACSSFTTEDHCHAGGCTWSGDSCELDDPNPDDTNVDCKSFDSESHCGTAGCVWKDNRCDEDEQADALLQENVSAAIHAIEDEMDVANEGTTWCRRRRVHRRRGRRWSSRSWGCRRRRARPTIKKAPKDGFLHECWNGGGCKDDGKNICGWCGLHNADAMYCCKKKNYPSGHACHGAVFKNVNNYHCVMPGGAQGYKWLDLSGATAKQSTTAHGGSASRAIDGSASAQWGQGSCTHTHGENNPWWQVDLKSPQIIKAVALTNRGDCCGSRLDGFSVKVGDKTCATGVKIAQGETKMVKCSNVASGSSIKVSVNKGLTCFTICEFRAAIEADPLKAKYSFGGLGVASGPEIWNLGNKGQGVQACYDHVMASSKCQKDYFTYVHRGDKNCGCKGSGGQLSVRADDRADYYKIQAPPTPAPATPAPTTPAPTTANKKSSGHVNTAAKKSLFDRIDLDSDNSLSRDELQKALDGGKIESTVGLTPVAPTAAAAVVPTVVASSIPSQVQKDALVRKHNDLRKGMGASDMTKMTWDDTLATAAQQWASSCAKGHSQNRGNRVGENMAWSWSSGFQLTASTDFEGSVQAWYDEIKDAGPYKSGGTFQGFGKCTGVCGHYTQVVWAAASKLGCGVASCPHSTGMPGYELVCQYGSFPGGWGGNMQGATVFTKGAACSSCPSGLSKCSDNLCSA